MAEDAKQDDGSKRPIVFAFNGGPGSLAQDLRRFVANAT